MIPISTEPPLYTLFKNKPRTLIPTILTQILLCIIFYLGILINLQLLSLLASEETLVRIISLLLILLLLSMGIYATYQKSNQPYNFYRTYLQIDKKNIPYNTITQIITQQNILDKLFHTYTLNANNKPLFNYIPQETDILPYLQQMIEYNQKSTAL